MAEWWWWSGQQRWWKNPFQVNDKMVMTVYASLMLADCRPAWCWKRRSLTKTGWYSFGNKSKPFNGSSISSEYSQIYLTVFAILDRNGFRKYWGLLPRRIPPVFLCPHLGWNAVFSGTLPKIRTGESWAPQWSHGKGFMDTWKNTNDVRFSKVLKAVAKEEFLVFLCPHLRWIAVVSVTAPSPKMHTGESWA